MKNPINMLTGLPSYSVKALGRTTAVKSTELRMRVSVVFLLLLWTPVVRGDFPCLCCYSLETAVYQAKALNAGTFGYMYEFDCKPLYENVTTDTSWSAIQFEHKIGFVQMTKDQVIQQCPGSIPTGDQVTEMPSAATSTTHLSPTQSPTTQPPSTAPQTTQPPTTQPATTQPPSTQPSTTQPPPTQPTTTQPPSTQPSITQSNTIQPTTHHSVTTNSMTSHMHTTQPITTPTSSTSQSATQSLTTQTPITQPTTRIQQMTTQSPHSITTHSTTMTTSHATTKHSTIHSTKPTAHPTLTTIHNTPTTMHHAHAHMPSTTHAPPNSCPHNVVNHASSHHHQGYVMSLGGSCFELVNHTQNWTVAEHSCHLRGGHLTSIKNQAEENALLVFMYNHGVKQEVWIGLNDRHQEQHFKWSSGLKLTWTNWIPDKQNNVSNNHDDCVALFPDDSMVGTWDDAHCGTTKPFICRFDAHPASHLIG